MANVIRRVNRITEIITYRDEYGKLHREDGPATIFPGGTRAFRNNNNAHRIDGPAHMYPNGYKEWWIDGKRTHPKM